ncbi:hypothetical protein Adt_17638 [Abeliophyllum distichum]|uniref:Retrotransposon protein n=1 Tax=Abeliophyllum distichum TaxID=126358 RepID=A0ABD1TH29_9LAMI
MVMTLMERVGVMEGKMEELHQDVKLNMETMKSEIRGQITTLLEKFNWMADKWEEQERGRKGKELEEVKPSEVPQSSEKSPVSHEGEGGGSSEKGGRPDYRTRRLEMPVFDGSDPDAWIFRAERYFSVNQMAEDERMEATAVCFEGEALAWFHWKKNAGSSQTGMD